MVPFSPGLLLLPLFVCGILAVSRHEPEDLLCGENERYLRCSGCEPSCKNPNPMCLMMCYPPKCQCLDGFFRNDEGRCVPLVQCVLEDADGTPPPHILPHDPEHAPSDGCENPNHCGENEQFYGENECASSCEPSCANPRPRICNKKCNFNVCRCLDGFVRHPSGKCVPLSYCPLLPEQHECGENAEYAAGEECDRNCEGNHIRCDNPRVRQCRCLPGFVRDIGQCVPKHRCPRPEPPVEFRCGKNEKYIDRDHCGAACEPSCLNPRPRVCTKQCLSELCQCENGFVRNPLTKECVRESECPKKLPIPTCGKNEEYALGGRCDPACDGQPTCTMDLVLRCRCLRGFVRSSSGICIPKNDCRLANVSTCGKNEVYDNGSPCEPTCDDPKADRVCTMDLVNKCRCLPGFVRGSSGNCIPENRCPKLSVCGAHEEFVEDGKNCESRCAGAPEPRIPCGSPLAIAIPGCKCSEGFARLSNGKCVLQWLCPFPKQVCPQNETYVEGGSACNEPTCKSPERPIDEMCLDIFNGCQCSIGFVRDEESGKCIREDHCPKPKPTCPQNETFQEHGSMCERSCEKPQGPVACPYIDYRGCRCSPGFVRDNGKCIRLSNCPKPKPTCPQNETNIEAGSACNEPTCKSIHATCKDILIGCQCSIGYVRDEESGKCIRLDHCPKPKHVCPQNETYVVHSSNCMELTCKNPNGKPSICRDDFTGCQCIPGFVRDEESEKCIRSNNCPNHGSVCSENEEGNDGGLICERTCKSKGAYDCNQHITRKCRCKQGYVRLDDYQCVRLHNCPEPKPTCPQNETYIEAGSACNERTCEDPYPLGSYCLDDFSGCQCSPGFARDKESRKCIPLSQCPEPKPECPRNETYVVRGSACDERTCENPLPNPSPFKCRDAFTGCQCTPGFVREKESQKCIRAKHCPEPKPKCPQNETYIERGSACNERTCKNPYPLGSGCRDNFYGCQCSPGFARDKESGKCIPLSQCPRPELPVCPANEKYVDCGKECEPSCEDLKPNACIMMCVKGCLCLPGFVRHPSGKCVPESYCPEPKPKCPRNETYVVGGSVCDERTCENANRPRPPFTCLDYFVGCQCSPGFVRDKESGKCIRVDHCPKPKSACPQNETYVEFGSSCDERTCKYANRPNFPCFSPFSGCQCSIGFVRNKESGKCIRVDHCPKPKPACSQNETFVDNGLKCEYSCTNPEEPEDCSLLDFTGCKCSSGFVRDKDSGKCVRVSHCPKPELHACGRNEMYVEKGLGCEQTCFELSHPEDKCLELRSGCFCKSGYVRDPENKCIPESKCSDILIRAGDDKFRHCCIDNGLPKEYLQVCNYTATIELTKLMIEYLSPNKSPRDRSSAVDVASTVLKCFIGGKDVSQCCRGKGVKESCLPICSAALYEISHVNPAELLGCVALEDANDVARNILKLAQTGTECFAEANAR